LAGERWGVVTGELGDIRRPPARDRGDRRGSMGVDASQLFETELAPLIT
jgi:hypothetical protein